MQEWVTNPLQGIDRSTAVQVPSGTSRSKFTSKYRLELLGYPGSASKWILQLRAVPVHLQRSKLNLAPGTFRRRTQPLF